MVRTSTGQVRINFHIQPDVLAALKRIASLRGTTYSDLIRLACREYVLAHAKQAARDHNELKEVGGP